VNLFIPHLQSRQYTRGRIVGNTDSVRKREKAMGMLIRKDATQLWLFQK
jgi:hypothetical protein